jgi:hypothetical protein
MNLLKIQSVKRNIGQPFERTWTLKSEFKVLRSFKVFIFHYWTISISKDGKNQRLRPIEIPNLEL